MSKKAKKAKKPVRAKKVADQNEEPLEKAAEQEEPPESDEPQGAELLSETGTKKGRQKRLPAMEDPEIEELEGLAEEYADIRDKRQNLTTQEVKLKSELLAKMQENKKETYFHNGILIRVVHKDTTVKVKIQKDDDE